jgi:hypothetical protein
LRTSHLVSDSVAIIIIITHGFGVGLWREPFGRSRLRIKIILKWMSKGLFDKACTRLIWLTADRSGGLWCTS